jgi:hypothetical protein
MYGCKIPHDQSKNDVTRKILTNFLGSLGTKIFSTQN